MTPMERRLHVPCGVEGVTAARAMMSLSSRRARRRQARMGCRARGAPKFLDQTGIGASKSASRWSKTVEGTSPSTDRSIMRPLFGIAACLLCMAIAASARAAERPLYGFDQQGIARELGLEQTYLTLPTAQGAAASLSALTAQARFDGSWGDGESARWMADRLRSFGWQTELAQFPAPLEWPKRIELELLAPQRVRFDLRESADANDTDAPRADAGIPFAYGSPDGNVRAPLVYADRGSAEDFAALVRAGVEVKGAIALLRNGAGHAGDVAQNAERAGAAGVILYPDPADDGTGRGTALPAGPWRPMGSARRVNVTTRVPLKIPVLPVTPAVAQRLLAAIPGSEAPTRWRGGLPAAYHLGRGGMVHLDVLLKRRIARLTNVVAMLPGQDPRDAVVIGSHRDAWAYGAADDASGIATLVEVARGLGYLYRAGWRPRRTIVVTGLDGAEIGSTGAYALAFEHQLPGRIAAYIDCDTCVTGSRFEAGALAPLAPLVRESAAAVPDGGGSTLAARWGGGTDLPLTTGDAAIFAYEAGVATIGVRFAGPYGVDGSAFDDARWMGTFGDPGYARHRELAQVIGTLALRLADAASLPQRWSAYGPTLDAALRSLSLDVKRSDLPIDLQPLRSAVQAFERSAARSDARIAAGTMPDAAQLDAASALIVRGADGPFNVIYGTGGGTGTLPAIAKPLVAGNEGRIEWGIETSAAALRRASDALNHPGSPTS
ncbi:M28 family peptidase [bacterium]|nr:MAG: M28 family peptidase [bacterium]